MSWYYTSAGVQLGPIPEDALRSLAASGRLLPTDLVWREGMPAWQPAGMVPGLLPGAGPAAAPPPFQQPYAMAPPLPPGIAPPGVAPARDDSALRWVLPVGRSGWAIASGYLGLLSISGILAPFALLTGILALREIQKNPQLGGRGRAIFGIVMGGLCTLFFVIGILAPMLSK